MPEDLPIWIRELVAEFLIEYDKWREIAEECSSRGHGLCDVAVEDFLTFCSYQLASPESAWMCMRPDELRLWPRQYNYQLVPHPDYPLDDDGCVDHNVVLLGDWAIDFTARQYKESLPFPFIWRTQWAGDSTSFRVPVTEATTAA